jgi:Mg2+ and Co2+ transporter CorA
VRLCKQVRDLADFVETRRQILHQRPGSRTNWISFAIAQFMHKQYDTALKVIEEYERSIEDQIVADADPNTEKYENSELFLFKVWRCRLNLV